MCIIYRKYTRNETEKGFCIIWHDSCRICHVSTFFDLLLKIKLISPIIVRISDIISEIFTWTLVYFPKNYLQHFRVEWFLVAAFVWWFPSTFSSVFIFLFFQFHVPEYIYLLMIAKFSEHWIFRFKFKYQFAMWLTEMTTNVLS